MLNKEQIARIIAEYGNEYHYNYEGPGVTTFSLYTQNSVTYIGNFKSIVAMNEQQLRDRIKAKLAKKGLEVAK